MRPYKLLVIKLCDERFGLDLADVHAIVPYREPTAIPGSSDYVEGIIATRGDAIVVVNLKKKFNMDNTAATPDSQIVIVNSTVTQVGFIVDETIEAICPDMNGYEGNSEIFKKVGINHIERIKNYQGKPIIVLYTEGIVRDIKI